LGQKIYAGSLTAKMFNKLQLPPMAEERVENMPIQTHEVKTRHPLASIPILPKIHKTRTFGLPPQILSLSLSLSLSPSLFEKHFHHPSL